MRAPRFRVGTLMILVALTAIPLAGAANLQRCARRFHERAEWHREQRSCFPPLTDLEVYLILAQPQGGPRPSGPVVEGLTRFIEHHNQMTEKYERAAVRPWLMVEADPPLPARPSADELCAYTEREYRFMTDSPDSEPCLRPIAEE